MEIQAHANIYVHTYMSAHSIQTSIFTNMQHTLPYIHKYTGTYNHTYT